MTLTQVILVAALPIFTCSAGVQVSAVDQSDNDPRAKQIFGYPVDRAYRVQDRGPQQFLPVTEETSKEQQYFREQDFARNRQQEQQPQPQPLFTPDQQQTQLQQNYQNYAQLLNQQQQYLSSTQQQQLQQQQLQPQQLQPQQFQSQQFQQHELQQQFKQPEQFQQVQSSFQQPFLQAQQFQQPTQQQTVPQQPTQQRQVTDPVASSISLLGVKYSAAPSVAHTMFRTNTGVSFSY